MERNYQGIAEIFEAEDTRPVRQFSYIQYSSQRDMPMLLAVRNATFICHSQLWEHLSAQGVETSRRSFNWRIQRLTQAGVIRRLPPLLPYPGPVYTITREGLACLEACGEGLVSLTSDSRSLANLNQMQHYLELAEVRAALRRAGLLKEWTGDLEIRSINLSIDVPLAKDYDAIADLDFEGLRYRIAIEYERSLKSSERYQEIISAITIERQVDLVLYLTSSLDLLYQLKAEFERRDYPIALAPSHAFCLNPITARLYPTRSLGATRATFPGLLRSIAAR